MIRKTYVDPELPITEEEARAALRIRHTAESSVLASKLRAAIEIVESRTTRLLRRHVLELYLDDWPCFDPAREDDGSIVFPVSPIREVVAVEYRNDAGAWLEILESEYDWRRTEEGGELYFFSTFSAPSLSTKHRDKLRVTFEAGYESGEETGSGDDPELLMPERARELVLMLAGHLYENREATTTVETFVVPLALDMILQDLRIFR